MTQSNQPNPNLLALYDSRIFLSSIFNLSSPLSLPESSSLVHLPTKEFLGNQYSSPYHGNHTRNVPTLPLNVSGGHISNISHNSSIPVKDFYTISISLFLSDRRDKLGCMSSPTLLTSAHSSLNWTMYNSTCQKTFPWTFLVNPALCKRPF